MAGGKIRAFNVEGEARFDMDTGGKVRALFEPEGRAVEVRRGATALEAARRAGLHIETPCGGLGLCGKCKVRFLEGAPPPTEADRRFLREEEISQGFRLACQARLLSSVVISIPSSTMLFTTRILGATRAVRARPQPAVRKALLRLPKPTVEDERADWERALDALGRRLRPASVEALVEAPRAIREGGFEVTAVVFEDEGSMALEPGDTTSELLGLAVDLGTTTIVASLVDLKTGAQLSVKSAPNPQMAFGDDVISRLTHAMRGGGEELREAALSAINRLLREACEEAGASPERVYEIVVSGNTAMEHLLLGLEVSQLATAPYVPAAFGPVYVRASDVGLKANREARLYVMPMIGGFVGGDTVSLILATGLHRSRRLRMAMDLGTNGEVAIGSREGVYACSTAAGPAFEGARVRQGMRATEGAIEKVELHDGRLSLRVVGNGKARGICGSGLVDAVALLLDLGVIAQSGAMLGPEEARGRLPKWLLSRLRDGNDGREFLLALPEESEAEGGVALTQRDIRELQLAKGAIRTGAEMLMRRLGIGPKDIEEVLVAGAFGNYLRPESAIRIGLLPPVPPERVRFVGNTSLLGARLCLLSRRKRREAERIARSVAHVELAGRPEFQETFVEMMLFPPREGKGG